LIEGKNTLGRMNHKGSRGMTYDPSIHHRRSIRLKGYDYAQAGAYFITFCTHQRQPFFGNIVRAGLAPAQIKLNECLKIFKTKNEIMGKLWQRNYYERIIRDEKSYLEIAQYILDNPAKWKLDSLHPGGTP
jgi:REP element-mobilizing transposase RayT